MMSIVSRCLEFSGSPSARQTRPAMSVGTYGAEDLNMLVKGMSTLLSRDSDVYTPEETAVAVVCKRIDGDTSRKHERCGCLLVIDIRLEIEVQNQEHSPNSI